MYLSANVDELSVDIWGLNQVLQLSHQAHLRPFFTVEVGVAVEASLLLPLQICHLYGTFLLG